MLPESIMSTVPDLSPAGLAAKRARAAERAHAALLATRIGKLRVPTPATALLPRTVASSEADQRVVMSVIVVTLGLLCILAVVGMTVSVRNDSAKSAIAGTFQKVHQQQQSFRLANARFATWPELVAAGARIPARQRVTRSSADASHWFLSVRDTVVGLVCDRTGELFDESGRERQAVCRSARP